MLTANGGRKLASLATIRQINPIPGADAIECAVVRSWPVVVGKGEYVEGDMVVHIEPDAALPLSDPRFASLAARGSTTVDGEQYHVLKTVRLRGQLSQGIVYPARLFPELADPDADIDEVLGVKLWEPPRPPVGADQKGPWDLGWLQKTDAERVQNLSDEWLRSVDDGRWVATEKIDGTSITYAVGPDPDRGLRVYSRNWELKTDDPDSTPMRLAAEQRVLGWMRANGVDAVQGEMFGAGIQANPLRMSGHHFAAFAAWEHQIAQGPFAHDRFDDLFAGWPQTTGDPLRTVPVLDLPFPRSVAEALGQADGMRSQINSSRLAEGIVWHHQGDAFYPELGGRLVFKAVSGAYLIKNNQ